MIEKSTLAYIKELQAKGETIFYNGEGSTDCYRNNIKHLSYAETLKLIKKISITDGIYFTVKAENLYVYCQEMEVVKHYIYGNNIRLIPLK